MQDILVKDILRITNGELIIGNENLICENFSKDTRIISDKDVYIGIKGENYDGNLLWEEALKKGASCVIVEKIDFSGKDLNAFVDKTIIKVNNTLESLYKIAEFKRNLYGEDFILVGVTGSVGKTSTKDIIASVLSRKYKTLKTEGNNNNNIGLPFTILRLRDHEAAVIEMGMNHRFEISLLTKIAKPTISVITNVGTSHIGNLGSRENILKAKLEILEGMKSPLLVINNDNDILHKWYEENDLKVDINTYGIRNKSDVEAESITLNEEDSQFICKLNEEDFEANVPVGGLHFVYNSMCASLVGKIAGLNIDEIRQGIESFELTKKRMDISVLKNGVKIINDSYNASYESMKASLEYLSEFKDNRRIAVLGDMFELGDFAEKLHKDVGEEVFRNKIDLLICMGENSKFIAQEALKCGMKEENIYYLDEKEKIINILEENMKANDVILFKASNGMKFFELVDRLKEKGGLYGKN